MKTDIAPACERGEELIFFLYGEADEREAQLFAAHLQTCSACKSEFAAFGQLRESIGSWKQEALSGFVSAKTAAPNERGRDRSALAALQEFFALAPLWMRGAVAFATVLLCLLAVLVMARLRLEQPPTHTANHEGAIYSQQDMDRIVKEALQSKSVSPQQAPEQIQTAAVQQKTLKNPTLRAAGRSKQLTSSRRPLSKSEREQLAADLRLITSGDEEGLDLLEDRINQ